MSIFVFAMQKHMPLGFAFDIRGLVQRVCMCVRQRSGLVEASYKRAPSVVRANRKLPCSLTVSCGSVCFFCCRMPFSSPLILTRGAMFQQPPPNTPQISSQQFMPSLFSLQPTFFCTLSLLLVPRWVLLLDHAGGGVALLWRLGSSQRSPMY